MASIFSAFANAFQSVGIGIPFKKQAADIVFSVENKSDYIVLPIVPADLPELAQPQNNETFESISGSIRVIGLMGLRKITIESLLPAEGKNYPFARPTGSSAQKVVEFFEKWRRKYIPLQCSITYGNGDVYIDMSCLVDEFTYYSDKVGDIHYSLKASEYKLGSELNSLLKMAAGVRNE